MKKQSISEKMLSYGIIINNAINESEIANAIALFGYTAEKLNAAKSLLDECDVLVNAQIKEYGEQFEATEQVHTLWDNAAAAYNTSLKIARIAFKENANAQAALLLNGDRKDSLSGWLQQAQSFYNNLENNADFVQALSIYGYTAEKIAAEKALLADLEVAKQAQAKEKGEAQQATVDRDKKLDELDEWISEFVVIARIALEDKPQLLEKLGILERS